MTSLSNKAWVGKFIQGPVSLTTYYVACYDELKGLFDIIVVRKPLNVTYHEIGKHYLLSKHEMEGTFDIVLPP